MNPHTDKSAPHGRRHRLTVVLSAVLLLFLILFGLQFHHFRTTPVSPPQTVDLHIAAGSSFSQICRQLADNGVIDHPILFRLLGRLTGVTAKLRAGDYRFSTPATPDEILQRLVAGDVRHFRFTVPEGLTLAEIAVRYQQAGFGRAENLLRAAADPKLLKQLDPGVSSLEGYLFPETYTLETTTTPRQLLQAMIDQFKRRVGSGLLAAAARRGLDRRKLVILASIVQKEAGNDAEMPLIAAVFHNRLRRRIPLQADPTVIYGISNFDGNLTRRDLETPTAYNTYTRAGLPAGPIANPGMAALEAAANPAAVDYLYFVARGDGTHEFSRTLAEHNRAVRKYQLGR
ncbi:hypothetical protein B5V00_16785 [Geothermobacter hydrogeniphilus]|uniref:Endolytic murein transglycosylase n=1 Tax=Geothermobacter hydrogeniphilus TaxID=1969733 RepID=A0A1X0XHU7_9BACT|nr:hypothetical protein B5V00_16785 [Geothermobacter hydrogeniphilus]